MSQTKTWHTIIRHDVDFLKIWWKIIHLVIFKNIFCLPSYIHWFDQFNERKRSQCATFDKLNDPTTLEEKIIQAIECSKTYSNYWGTRQEIFINLKEMKKEKQPKFVSKQLSKFLLQIVCSKIHPCIFAMFSPNKCESKKKTHFLWCA